MYESLIKNQNMEIDFKWQLWGAEVDLISIALTGEKNIITKDQLSNFLAGVLDSIVIFNVSNENARDISIASLNREGKSSDYIERYLKGWDVANKVLSNKKVD